MKFFKLQESLLKDLTILLLQENIITFHIYLNGDEADEYERLLWEIHHSNNIDELINTLKEQQRINFIHKVLLRYKEEYDNLTKSMDSDNYEELILNYIDRTGKDHDAKRTYLSLVRRFRNEIKRMREKVLIKIP
ncbi:hypothetical protein AN965_10640 [Alkalicoccobacillus plakortidis]|uniref:Uncharacterized protein n=1 Tax=Alkalicoccobacillus plakortidis TaxID=444060 RepID=A0A9D5DQ70_9BACI|nr:hypothetical protein [Alkalicoccobacillus plakortidis]KQL57120.1 hypothetical protein AN965_10640 [Alkalicoccobacillus plakortidis]